MSEQNRSARSRYEAARAAFDAAFERHLDAGVEFVSRDGICIDPEVEIAPGVLILPGTILRGKTRIGAGSVIARTAFWRMPRSVNRSPSTPVRGASV